MTVHSRARAARTPSWFERLPNPLIGQSPAKANPYWSHHSLSSPGRLEGTLQCWLVALNSQKKGVGVQILGNTAGWKKQQSNRAEKGASRSEDELDEGANGVVRVQQVLHQAPIRGAQPGPAALQGEPRMIRNSCLFCFGDFSRAEKYADPVYKSSCVALTVKIGRLCNSANRIAETVGFFKSTNSLLKRFNEFLAF